MKKHQTRKLLSLVLAICMLLSLAAPAAAAPAANVTFTQIDNSAVTADLLTKAGDDLNSMETYVDSDMVRVSIFLDDQSTIMAGYSVDSISANAEARAYRSELKAKQEAATAAIEKAIGGELDVVWNLTLAANIISANVRYGQIETIEAVDGVSQVLVETCYEPDVVRAEQSNDPNMSTSSAQIGSPAAWAAGYTGAGSRIAVIDTGADTDHQSLNPDAFQYSLAYCAGKSGMSMEEYAEYIDLLDAEEIAAVSADLNAPVGAEAYVNEKIPFGFNYVDGDLDITHDNDAQGSHGSHVAGIATANSYLMTEDGFVPSLNTAMVQGVAPDAQLIVMKVFGKSGGAYDSDYMAAIEDAIVLGCDAANLSLGSGNPGTSRNASAEYQAIMESLTKAGIVVAMSAGNSGYWAESAYNAGYLYAEDVSMQTNGSPGSFTNSLSVASVDNDGKTGYYITVGDMMIVYNEMLEGSNGAYKNQPFTTIAGEHEYVLIDAIGTPEDFAVVGEALTGKIALCYRGETSFFEKANAAVEAGAIATFIINNQPGVINMDLTDYTYTAPCASLTMADGAAIMAASTPVTDEAGNILYYTGTMTVSDTMGAGQFNSDYYTMSSFSSWGVPGSLELKPEITAPGGSIYSINGVDPSGEAYEVMSGTSMASPQVAGMAAVVAQYIRENGLDEQTGLSARQLAQSLLMSTAEPILADAASYYSVMQQGAGLANVGAAVSADSYITMADGSSAGAADGKVKVELGDDPDRAGAYSATFTINNLTDTDKAFDLGADFFIQAPTSDGVNLYMYTSTVLIGMDAVWTVDGDKVEPTGAYAGCDFNGDGAVNSDDGQAILDYATGVETELTNLDKADLDADGDVDSYDAYLFLSGLNSAAAVVPANGSAEVTVEFSMSDDWKYTLDYYYPNGTYIQGYLYAESLTDEEGVAGTSHSIPVLGFFGNWTDPSMFDVGCYQTYTNGQEQRPAYLSKTTHNTYLVTYANEPDAQYYLGGNPLVPDSVYMPERNAINSADVISGVDFIAIRNAADSVFVAANETTGEVLYQVNPGKVDSAYFYVNGGYWQNIGYTLPMDVDISSASEGDVVSVGLTLVPEYYVDAEGNVNWEALGTGATLGNSFVIDNTAPELFDVSISLTKNALVVSAADNEYVAAVALYNKAGSRVLSYAGSKSDIEKNETAEYVLPLEGVSGSKFLLQVSDYALNTTTFVVELQVGGEQELPEMIVFDLTNNFWTTFSQDTVFDYNVGMDVYETSDHVFHAGTIVDHMVLAATDAGDLYIMPEDELSSVTYVSNLGVLLTDMAYNKADDLVYGVTDQNELVTVDRLDGSVEVIGTIGVTTNTLACDANGTFYCNQLGTGNIYTFTVDTIGEPEILVDDIYMSTVRLQSMEINPNTGMLCWNSYYVLFGFLGYSYYYEIDPATGEWTQYNDLWDEYTCLLIPEKPTSSGSWTDPVDEVTGMQISRTSIQLLRGTSYDLFASVQPWNASDRSITWSSADDSIATVDENGVVTGIKDGTTVVTATSNLDPSVSVSCEIVVESLQVTINGTLQDAEGNPMFYTWNLATDETWTGGTAIDTSMASATYSTKEDVYYIMDGVSGNWGMHKVGPDGVTAEFAVNPTGVPFWDMSYSEYFTEVNGYETVNGVYYYYLIPNKDPMALNANAFGLSSYVGYLTCVATAGYEEYVDDKGVVYDTEHLMALDNIGNVWHFWIYNNDDGTMGAFLGSISSDLELDFAGHNNLEQAYCSMVVGEDGNLYLSAFNGDTNEIYRLVYNESSGNYVSSKLGDVGMDVWPATITSVTNNVPADGAESVKPAVIEQISAETVSAEEIASAADSKAAKIALNSESAVSTDEKTVTVDITASESVTNGVMDITWNAEALELVGYASTASYTSAIEDEGKLTFGYVALAPIDADETIVTLTFNVKDADDSVVTVSHKQMNNAAGSTEEIKVEFEHAKTEVRGAIEATCTTSGYTGDTYCTDCGKLIAKGSIIEALGHSYEAVVTEPTCTEGGYTTYTCSVCGDSYINDYTDPCCASAAFADVALDAWYHEAVDFVVENGLMNGVSATAFAPDAMMNRAQMVTVLYRLAGSPAVDTDAAFEDVPADVYYTDAVAWAVANGITNGISEKLFDPYGMVSREVMVTFLYRYAKFSGADVTVTGDLSAYDDAADVSSFAVDAFTWAVEKGIVSGVTETTLLPTATASRAQVATVLMRFAK